MTNKITCLGFFNDSSTLLFFGSGEELCLRFLTGEGDLLTLLLGELLFFLLLVGGLADRAASGDSDRSFSADRDLLLASLCFFLPFDWETGLLSPWPDDQTVSSAFAETPGGGLRDKLFFALLHQYVNKYSYKRQRLLFKQTYPSPLTCPVPWNGP